MKFDNIDQVSLVELASTQSWQDKYRLLIRWGKLITKKDALRCDQYRVEGCELSVWFYCERGADKRYRCAFDSDSQIMNGLAAVLLSVVNSKNHAQVLALPLDTMLHDMGLQKHLTPSRANGFFTIVKQLKRSL